MFLFASLPGKDSKEEDAAEVIKRIRSSAQFLDTEENDPNLDKVEMKEENEKDEVLAAATKVITAEGVEDIAKGANYMPRDGRTTLGGTLQGHESLDAALPDLWKLLFFLRSGPGGSDTEILPSPMLSRQRVQSDESKWHNVLMHRMSLMDAKEPCIRQGRLAAWIQHVEKTRLEQAPTLPENVTVNRSDVVAFKQNGNWQVGVIISIWRILKAKSGGGQLCSRELARGSMSAARIVRALFDV